MRVFVNLEGDVFELLDQGQEFYENEPLTIKEKGVDVTVKVKKIERFIIKSGTNADFQQIITLVRK